jgi:tRNA 2-thiouridine synthesizing protein A
MPQHPVFPTAHHHLDCSWMLCPVPILMTAERIAGLGRGEVLEVIYTDPGAKPDLEAWCAAHGHELVGIREGRPASAAFVRKGAR